MHPSIVALGLLLSVLTVACSDRSAVPALDETSNGPEGPIHGSDGPLFTPPAPTEEPPPPPPGEQPGGGGGTGNSTGGNGGGGGTTNGGGGGSGGGNGGPGSAVPEPGTMLLVGSGLAGLAWRRRRRKSDDEARDAG